MEEELNSAKRLWNIVRKPTRANVVGELIILLLTWFIYGLVFTTGANFAPFKEVTNPIAAITATTQIANNSGSSSTPTQKCNTGIYLGKNASKNSFIDTHIQDCANAITDEGTSNSFTSTTIR